MGTVALRRTKLTKVNGQPLVYLPDKRVMQVGAGSAAPPRDRAHHGLASSHEQAWHACLLSLLQPCIT
jgi:hypothetical protein